MGISKFPSNEFLRKRTSNYRLRPTMSSSSAAILSMQGTSKSFDGSTSSLDRHYFLMEPDTVWRARLLDRGMKYFNIFCFPEISFDSHLSKLHQYSPPQKLLFLLLIWEFGDGFRTICIAKRERD